MNPIIDLINKKSLKKSIPDVKTGDIVRVSQRIKEGNKTRAQVFEGVVIAREGGNGVTASITVRKIASGVGVEKKFLLNSPNIESVKILRSSKVRRSKIFFLRGLTGKAAKLKEKQRKMLGEIGLKEDEEIETAETTEELAQAPSPAEDAEGNPVEEQENQEEEKTEEKIDEPKVEESTEEVKAEEGIDNNESDEAIEQKVEEIVEAEAPIEEKKEEENLEQLNNEETKEESDNQEKVE